MPLLGGIRPFLLGALMLVSATGVWVDSARAQGRINDKDLARLIQNLRDDAKSFRPRFDSAVHKSTIRKTSREKDAKNLSQSFVRQTDGLLQKFKRTHKGDDALQVVRNTAQQLNRLVYQLQLGPDVTNSWDRIRTELQQIYGAFGVPDNLSATATPAMGDTAYNGPSCLQGVGQERSQRLVDECLSVSPATHPPCNAQNSCVLIIDEIKRGCSLLGAQAPPFCAEYR
jgi:hypothetical protein